MLGAFAQRKKAVSVPGRRRLARRAGVKKVKMTGLALVFLAAGCASATGAEPTEIDMESGGVTVELELTLPENGFQIEILGNMIEPGDDIEWCEVVRLPGTQEDVYYVNALESAMTPHGHYLWVSAAVPGSETEANMETGTRVNCQRAGEVFGEDLVDVISTQHLYDEVRFPQGVGKVFTGGQKIVVDYHYYNTSQEAVAARAKINFHLVNESEVRTAARSASFNNLTIYTPPGGESSHLAECLVTQDILVSSLTRHTHRWGTDFKVWFAAGERRGERIWTSSDWERDTRYEFPDGAVLLKAGEGFRFQCDYRNTTNEELQFGVNATDEVCVLHATYWPAREGDEAQDQGCLLFFVDEDGVARK